MLLDIVLDDDLHDATEEPLGAMTGEEDASVPFEKFENFKNFCV